VSDGAVKSESESLYNAWNESSWHVCFNSFCDLNHEVK
jgi:hypothetical protein